MRHFDTFYISFNSVKVEIGGTHRVEQRMSTLELSVLVYPFLLRQSNLTIVGFQNTLKIQGVCMKDES